MILDIEQISVSYGAINALRDVSFSLDEGEIVALIGANGAGKSTSLNTISGLLRPTSGKVVYQGQDLTKVSAKDIVRLGIVQVPEGRKIFSKMTVWENLEMGAYTVNDRKLIEERLESAYQRFPRLKERRTQPGGTLSGGEQQMLAISTRAHGRTQSPPSG